MSSVIPAFAKRGDLIVCDEGVSYAVELGVQLSRCQVANTTWPALVNGSTASCQDCLRPALPRGQHYLWYWAAVQCWGTVLRAVLGYSAACSAAHSAANVAACTVMCCRQCYVQGCIQCCVQGCVQCCVQYCLCSLGRALPDFLFSALLAQTR